MLAQAKYTPCTEFHSDDYPHPRPPRPGNGKPEKKNAKLTLRSHMIDPRPQRHFFPDIILRQRGHILIFEFYVVSIRMVMSAIAPRTKEHARKLALNSSPPTYMTHCRSAWDHSSSTGKIQTSRSYTCSPPRPSSPSYPSSHPTPPAPCVRPPPSCVVLSGLYVFGLW